MSLFAAPPNAGAAASSHLVSFKAGKCTMDSENNVTPLKYKGQVFVEKDNQGLTIFVFKNRETDTRTDEIYVFPGEATFKKCKSSKDRVYLLKIANRREFFWMQDKDDSKDEENATKLNDILTGNFTPGTASGGSGAATAMEEDGGVEITEDELAVLNALPPEEREQTLQMLGLSLPPGMAVAPTPAPASSSNAPMDVETPATSATPAAPPPVRAIDTASSQADAGPAAASFNEETLRNVMAGVGSVLRAAQQQNSVSLTDVLGREQIDALLGEEAFVSALIPLLPEGEQSLEGLKQNISSPQFKEALASLTAVLSSDGAAAMMGQFGVDPALVAQGGGGAAGLLHAIQAKADESNPAKEPTPEN